MKQLTKDPELHEEHYNPSPKAYRVPRWIKMVFFVGMLGGFFVYGSLIVERHHLQRLFLQENHLAPIKLNNVMVPELDVVPMPKQQTVSLKTITDGRFVLLNLWGTFCRTCALEMPSLAMLQGIMGDRLTVVALSVDEDKNKVLEYIEKNNPNFIVAWDLHQNASVLFGIEKYPETFLIAPNGKIVAQFSGSRDWASKDAIEYLERQIHQSP